MVALEADFAVSSLLAKNVRRNQMNVRVVNDFFSLNHLSIPHDFLKMDIDGAEDVLLGYHGKLRPCVIEVHEDKIVDLTKLIVDRFGFDAVWSFRNFGPASLVSSEHELYSRD